MNDHDDLERTVTRSLRQRAERAATSVPDLDGVWAHVDRRRNRRRHVAVVGSLAVVAVGALGIATLGGEDPNRIPAPAAAPDLQAAWRCTNQLDHFEPGSSAVFFATCEPTEVDGTAPVFDQPTNTAPTESTAVAQVDPTVPTTVLGTPVPTIGWVCEGADSDDVMVTVPCVEIDAPASTLPSPGAGVATYVVMDGDTVESIGNAFNVSVGAIVAANAAFRNGELPLSPGAVILVPRNDGMVGVPAGSYVTGREQTYRVEQGDSVVGIAARFGFLPDTLAAYNSWPDGLAHVLLFGDEILIPPGGVIDEPPFPTTTITTTTSVP